MKGKMWLVVVGVVLAGVIVWANFFTGSDRPTPVNTPLPTITVTGPATPSGPASSTASATPTPTEGNVFDPENPPDGAPSSEEIHKAMDTAKTYWQALNTYGYGDTKVSDAIRHAMPLMTPEKRSEWQQDLAEIDAAGDSGWKSLVKNHRVNLTLVQDIKIQEWDSEQVGVLWIALKYRSGTVDAGATSLSGGAKDQYVAVRMVQIDDQWLASEERPVD